MSFEVGDKVIILGDETWQREGFMPLIGKQGVIINTDVSLPGHGNMCYLEVDLFGEGIYTLPRCLKKVGEEQLLFSFMEE